MQPAPTSLRQTLTGRLPRHSHRAAYAAIVLEGGYVEAGDAGRYKVEAGDMLVHASFQAHQNSFDRNGAKVLNLPVGAERAPIALRIADTDAIVRVAERDARAASALAFSMVKCALSFCEDWPDLLAEALRRNRVSSIEEWAEEIGLARTSVSRGFARAYGVAPQRYRLQNRASRAARMIVGTSATLAQISDACGYSDQSHMTRDFTRFIGATPARLRHHHVTRVQDGIAPVR